MTEKEKAFLIDLEAITRKHGIIVSGCGCCGSPSLFDMDLKNDKGGYGVSIRGCDFAWVSSLEKDFDELKGNIAKVTE